MQLFLFFFTFPSINFFGFLLKLGIKGIALSDVWTNFNLVGSLIIYIIISTVYVKTWGLKFPPSVSKVSHSKLHFSLLRMVVVRNHDFTMWIVTQSLSNRCFSWVFWFKPRLWSTFSLFFKLWCVKYEQGLEMNLVLTIQRIRKNLLQL